MRIGLVGIRYQVYQVCMICGAWCVQVCVFVTSCICTLGCFFVFRSTWLNDISVGISEVSGSSAFAAYPALSPRVPWMRYGGRPLMTSGEKKNMLKLLFEKSNKFPKSNEWIESSFLRNKTIWMKMKTHDVFMSHSAFPCALSLGCWSGRTEIILASTVLLTSAAVDPVVRFQPRWWVWVWNPEGCCHAVTSISESFSVQTTDSHVCVVVLFIFHFARYLRTTKVLNPCFLFDFERAWKIEAFSRSMLFVMIFTTAPRVGCKLRASAQRKRRQAFARCFANSVSPRLKDHRRSQRKRRHWRA